MLLKCSSRSLVVWSACALLTLIVFWSLVIGDLSDARAKLSSILSSSSHSTASSTSTSASASESSSTSNSDLSDPPQTTNPDFWSQVEHVFSFGDSYTSTWFSVLGPPPRPEAPMGNRDRAPVGNYYDNPKWLEFLTGTYNTTPSLVWNLAYGGATIDRNIIHGNSMTPVTFNEQIDDFFLPYYSNPESSTAPAWESDKSLFTFFLGINDITLYLVEQRQAPYDLLMQSYKHLLNEVFDAGARRFLFLNLPPLTEVHFEAPTVETERVIIDEYNTALSNMRDEFVASHREELEGNTWFLDVHTLWADVISDPTRFDQTKDLKELRKWCLAYVFGTPELDTFNEQCGYPVNQYLWQNDLHATFVIHNLTAAIIVKDCFSSEGPKGYCS